MSEKLVSCCVCGNYSDVIVSLPLNLNVLNKWADILENDSIKISPRQKKMCLLHFPEKWHKSLKDPVCKRSPYCFPIKEHTSTQIHAIKDPSSSSSFSSAVNNPLDSNEQPSNTSNKQKYMDNLVDDVTLHNRCKKPTDYEAVLQMKEAQIDHLDRQVKTLTLENKKLCKEMEKNLRSENLIDALSTQFNLGEHSQAMLKLLLTEKDRPVYSHPEISLCQSIYYKSSGTYSNLRKLLDNKLPSIRSLSRWNELKDFNVGVVKPVLNFLIKKHAELSEEDKELILILDEMDGKRDLTYDSARDMIVGFEDLFERKPIQAKKFLSLIIKGVNNKIGNLVLANYATANGITGIETSIYNSAFLYENLCLICNTHIMFVVWSFKLL